MLSDTQLDFLLNISVLVPLPQKYAITFQSCNRSSSRGALVIKTSPSVWRGPLHSLLLHVGSLRHHQSFSGHPVNISEENSASGPHIRDSLVTISFWFSFLKWFYANSSKVFQFNGVNEEILKTMGSIQKKHIFQALLEGEKLILC